MSKVFAVVENGVVQNVILADAWPDGIDVTGVSPQPGPGWTYANGTFSPPAPVVVNYGTKVTKLAFRQRLGQNALVALELASIHNPAATPQAQQQAAAIRVMLEDVRIATYIDLSRPDTRAGVQQVCTMLEAMGVVAPGHAAAVLDTPVTQAEVPSL